MAERYVGLIRGINVGRAKRVAMADLRALVADLGYTDVRTLLNSGNVVFTATDAASPPSATRIQEELFAKLGVQARVTVLGAPDVTDAVRGNPLLEIAHDPSRLLVAFFAGLSERSLLEPLVHQNWTPEALALGNKVAYLWCPDGVSDSLLALTVGNVLGDAVTSRNWATVLKLQTLIDNPA